MPIQLTLRNLREVNRCRAHAPHTLRSLHDACELSIVVVGVGNAVVGETCRNERVAQCVRLRDPQPCPIRKRPRATLCREQLVVVGVIDDARHGLPLAPISDGDGENGVAVRVVHCAVEWVNVPHIVIGSCQHDLPFFGDDSVTGKLPADGGDEHGVNRMVNFGDEVDVLAALAFDGKMSVEAGALDASCLAGELDSTVEGAGHRGHYTV